MGCMLSTIKLHPYVGHNKLQSMYKSYNNDNNKPFALA